MDRHLNCGEIGRVSPIRTDDLQAFYISGDAPRHKSSLSSRLSNTHRQASLRTPPPSTRAGAGNLSAGDYCVRTCLCLREARPTVTDAIALWTPMAP